MNQKTSIFHSSKNHGSMTRVTRIKIEVNMTDRSHMSFREVRITQTPLAWRWRNKQTHKQINYLSKKEGREGEENNALPALPRCPEIEPGISRFLGESQ